MIEYLRSELEIYRTNEEKYNRLRELLQLMILGILDEQGFFKNIAFLGGTALRIIYKLNRFSEDLDFSLVNSDNYTYEDLITKLEKSLLLMNLDLEVKSKGKHAVKSSFFKFNKLLSALNISSLKDEKIKIKFDVDENPPLGYKTEVTMIKGASLIAVNHFDLASLYAGKLNAVLCRKYTKGRDFYDLLWYASQEISPNLVLLERSIEQSTGEVLKIDSKKLQEMLLARIEDLDFGKVIEDLSPFILDRSELRFFTKEHFRKFLKS